MSKATLLHPEMAGQARDQAAADMGILTKEADEADFAKPDMWEAMRTPPPDHSWRRWSEGMGG